MSYNLTRLPVDALLRPTSAATAALVRLDERIARSVVGSGWIERMHFLEACASLWIDGELVHLEDLVLHDANHDVRAPTHEITIAHDILKTRRRIAVQRPEWALSDEGLRSLRGNTSELVVAGNSSEPEPPAATDASHAEGEGIYLADPLAEEFAEIDAVLARSAAALTEASLVGRPRQRDRDPLVYDLDWNEDERFEEWSAVLRQTENLPSVLQAIVVLDAWNILAVSQHAPWLGRLLAASLLRQAGLTTGAHLAAINLGLKSIPFNRRRHRDRDTRLLALAQCLVAAAELGLKEHDRLTMARQMMERRLVGRRASSRLPALIDLVIDKPLVSAGMIAETVKVTPRAALRIVEQLGLREMTGRGRFRAWGVL